MDETPNVNNLNGVPNFGHGFPENVPVEEVVADAAAPEGVEIEAPVEAAPAEEAPVEEAPAEEAPVEALPEQAAA